MKIKERWKKAILAAAAKDATDLPFSRNVRLAERAPARKSA